MLSQLQMQTRRVYSSSIDVEECAPRSNTYYPGVDLGHLVIVEDIQVVNSRDHSNLVIACDETSEVNVHCGLNDVIPLLACSNVCCNSGKTLKVQLVSRHSSASTL